MKVNPMKFVSASLPVNKFKNRLVNILPCELFLCYCKPLNTTDNVTLQARSQDFTLGGHKSCEGALFL